eukprot:354132-Prorocentrum_minimum.AAC.1
MAEGLVAVLHTPVPVQHPNRRLGAHVGTVACAGGGAGGAATQSAGDPLMISWRLRVDSKSVLTCPKACIRVRLNARAKASPRALVLARSPEVG